MGRVIKRDVEKIETIDVGQKMNKAVVDNFRDRCKMLGYPMNVVLETFMLQYADGRFAIPEEEIRKWEHEDYEVASLKVTFNRYLYTKFKRVCKDNGFFLKYVETAFMEKFAAGTLRLEYVDISNLGLAPMMLSVAEQDEIQSKENNKMRCPYCGRYVEGDTDNWILIQHNGDAKKYLACRECGARNDLA